MIVLDTSEYMRNGDYLPSRFAAEIEAAQTVFNAKTRANPENTVGLMTMAGDVKVTFITDTGKFLYACKETKITGNSRLSAAVQVAQLALRHRQNKNQRQRIVVFVGSPVTESEHDLQRLAAKMKKNNIAIDFVNFGQEADNTAKLQLFVDTVNSGDNSHLLDVPPGPYWLSEQVSHSAILGAAESGGETGFMDDDLGADADPELEMALRMSLEEEQQRQQRATQEDEANKQ